MVDFVKLAPQSGSRLKIYFHYLLCNCDTKVSLVKTVIIHKMIME